MMAKIKRQDIVKYIFKIRLNFENAYPTRSDEEFDLLVESWFDILKEYPKEICDCAVNNALKNAKFAPRIGNITEEIESLINADSKSDEELWTELNSILHKVFEVSRYQTYSQYYAWAQAKLTEIYNSLDQLIQTYIVNITTLVEISMQTGEDLKFEKSRFFKAMPSIRKKLKDRKQAEQFLKLAGAETLSLQLKNNS